MGKIAKKSYLKECVFC